MIVKDIRVRNINLLSEQMGRKKLAELLGYEDTGYVNQLCRGLGSFGDTTARKIEDRLNLGSGWMDTPQWDENQNSVTNTDVTNIYSLEKKLYLLSPEEVVNYEDVINNKLRDKISPTVIAMDSDKLNKFAFAFEVHDDSMSPKFNSGDIVVFNPIKDSKEVLPGAFVIAFLSSINKAIFRQYKVRSGGSFELFPLNDNWPSEIIQNEEEGYVIGILKGRYEVF